MAKDTIDPDKAKVVAVGYDTISRCRSRWQAQAELADKPSPTVGEGR